MDCACGKPAFCKNGTCRSCHTKALNADPVHKAKLMAGIAKRWAKPGEKQRMAEVCRQSVRKRDLNPSNREILRQQGLKMVAMLQSAEVRAKALSPEAIRRRADACSATRMAWCPVEYRAEYKRILDMHGMRSPEARRIIEDQIAADRAKAEAALSPFDRQMRALERGARLVANDSGPSLDRPADHGESRWTYGVTHG